MKPSSHKIRPKRYAHPRAIGAYSSAGAMAMLDGRTKQALFMQRLRKKLLAHVGDDPSVTQRMLVERAVRLSMQVELFDEKFLKVGHSSDRDQRQYLAYSNALSRTLRQLGLNSPKPPVAAAPVIPRMVEGDLSVPSAEPPAPSKTARRTEEVGLPSGGFLRDFDEHFNRKKEKPRSAEPGSFQTHVVVR